MFAAIVTLAFAVQQLTSTIDGPPAPAAPDVISCDAPGRTAVRAIKPTTPTLVKGLKNRVCVVKINRLMRF